MTSKIRYTKEEYQRESDENDHRPFGSKVNILSDKSMYIQCFRIQSGPNRFKRIHVLFANSGHVDVYFDDDVLLSDLLNFIKGGIKKDMKKLPQVAHHLGKVIELNMKQIASIPKRETISGYIDNALVILEKLVGELQSKEVLTHIKNFGIKFQDLDKMIDLKIKSFGLTGKLKFLLEKELNEHTKSVLKGIEYASMETFEDKIKEIILTQKTKKFIQKTFSIKNRFLINDDTFNLIKELVMKDVSKTEFHDTFALKIARYNDAKEFNSDLRQYIQQAQGWSIDQYIDKAKELDIEVLYDKDNVLTLKIDSYEQSKSIGSQQWCISYDEDHFMTYHDNKIMFFMYDFNKDIDDNTSMLGMVIETNNVFYAGHWKNDRDIEDDEGEEFRIKMKNYYPAIISADDIDCEKYIRDYIYKTSDPERRKKTICSNFNHLESACDIDFPMQNGMLDDLNPRVLHDWIKLGYYGDNESDLSHEWKKNVFNALNDCECITNIHDPITAREIIKTNDIKLIDIYFKRVKGDSSTLEFGSNVNTWQVIESAFEDNDDGFKIVLNSLKENNFKFTKEDIKEIKKYVHSISKEEEFKKIVKEYKFAPLQVSKKNNLTL